MWFQQFEEDIFLFQYDNASMHKLKFVKEKAGSPKFDVEKNRTDQILRQKVKREDMTVFNVSKMSGY